jgi:hypothetical protein
MKTFLQFFERLSFSLRLNRFYYKLIALGRLHVNSRLCRVGILADQAFVVYVRLRIFDSGQLVRPQPVVCSRPQFL